MGKDVDIMYLIGIDEGVWGEFLRFVNEKYGNLNEALGNELTRALEEYLEKYI